VLHVHQVVWLSIADVHNGGWGDGQTAENQKEAVGWHKEHRLSWVIEPRVPKPLGRRRERRRWWEGCKARNRKGRG
jgi:hypothetical protein